MLSKLVIRNVVASSSWRLTSAPRILSTLHNECAADGKRLVSSAKFQTPPSDQSYQTNFTHNPVEGYIRNSPFDMVTTPNMQLDHYVWQNMSNWQNHTAMVCGITGRSYTYAQLRDHSAALAIRLQTKLNLQVGDRVAVCLPNIPEYAISTLGSIEAGLVVTSINPLYTVDDIRRQLEQSSAKVIFSTPKIFPTIKRAVEQTKRDIKIICMKTDVDESIPSGSIDLAELINTSNVDFSSLKANLRHPDDMVFLPYSSGTTGLPKGVMLSHNNIAVNCEQIGVKLVNDLPLIYPTTDDWQEVSPSVLPFFHIYGFTVLLVSKLSLGAKIITLPEFNPNTFMNSITEHKATILHVVPPILIYLASQDSVDTESLGTVRTVMSGAAPLGASDVERFFKKAPHSSIIQGYGLTETSPACLLNTPGNTKYASVGSPASATRAKIVKLDDNTGMGLPANESGELWVKGPQNMIGYLDNPKATNEMLIEGWIRTGDIAYYDEDGYFYITDRLKELIKVKGFQVPPAELEEVIRSHPDVLDAAVVGIPHQRNGEAPKAFVVKRKESQSTEEEIARFVAGKVVDYKQLTGGVQFLDAIPKNTTGKILRREIKLKYCQ